MINQYEIVLVNLDPTIGSEISKTRPCVIISPDEINHHLKTIVVVLLTTTSKNYPTRVKLIFDKKESWIAIDQIRTIDKLRIIKVLGSLTAKEIHKIKLVIEETFVK